MRNYVDPNFKLLMLLQEMFAWDTDVRNEKPKNKAPRKKHSKK